MLDPAVELRADAAGVRMGSAAVLRGAHDVAKTFSGRAHHAQVAMIDGEPGLAWLAGGLPRVVFRFTIAGDTVTAIDLIADRATLSTLDLAQAPYIDRP
jgi:RNA polymerase sigma-70 factor (ECF subfamily)